MSEKERIHERYVAHFDVLGFKSLTLNNPDEAWGVLSDLEGCQSDIVKKSIYVKKPEMLVNDRIRFQIFSDSVLFYTVSNKPEDLLSIIIMASQFFADALASCVPLRGGIAYGDFFFNREKSLYCGVPLVKAYEIGENAQWMGIVVDETLISKYEKELNLTSGNMPTLIQWKLQQKNKKHKICWVVNWPVIYKDGFTKKKPPLEVKEFYRGFEGMFGSYDKLSKSSKKKHINTVRFINYTFKKYMSDSL